MFDVTPVTSRREVDCGPTCLKMLLAYYGIDVPLEQLIVECGENVWGCTGTTTISKDTRNVIEQLSGTENFFGQVLDCRHGQVLGIAINENGLHAEYMAEGEPAGE